MRILLIEDRERVAQSTGAALRSRGYAVTIASTLREANDRFAEGGTDLAIVDVGLPDGSGLEWCRMTRQAGSEVPILLLTARTALPDRVAGLDAGADDYLGKPFAVEELLARIRALGRRGPRWSESSRSYGRLALDRDRRLLTVDGERVPLTPREFDIVAEMAWRDGRVILKSDLLDAVWGESGEGAAASLDVLIARIRRKLGERGVNDAIRTIRQIGYAWALTASKRA